jgi:hypothetical protein
VERFFIATLDGIEDELTIAEDLAAPILQHVLARRSGSVYQALPVAPVPPVSTVRQRQTSRQRSREVHLQPAGSEVELQPISEVVSNLFNQRVDLRTREGFKRMLTDLYRTATLLQNFQMLNHTGFVKLFKRLARPCFPTTLRPEVRFRTYSCCVDGV